MTLLALWQNTLSTSRRARSYIYSFLFFETWPSHNSSRSCVCMLTVRQHLGAIHKNMHHTGTVLMWVFKRSMVSNFCRIKNGEIGKIASCQCTAPLNLNWRREERSICEWLLPTELLSPLLRIYPTIVRSFHTPLDELVFSKNFRTR